MVDKDTVHLMVTMVHLSSNNNATAFEATAVLQGGVLAPIYPAVLLAIWALGSMLLGLLYGFRRR
jgi:hypothetical protein